MLKTPKKHLTSKLKSPSLSYKKSLSFAKTAISLSGLLFFVPLKNNAFAHPGAMPHSLGNAPHILQVDSINQADFKNHVIDLNLNSILHTILAGQLTNFHDATINVGGHILNVNSHTLLTSSEAIALNQVATTGHQDIILGAQGNAVGGSLNLSSFIGQNIGSIDIPQSVSAYITLSHNNETLNINHFVNNGQLDATTNNHNLTFTIDTSSLTNSGLITTQNSQSPLNLNISAESLSNSGQIASSNNIGIETNAITNSGSISANHDLNINPLSTNTLNIENQSGTLSAQNNINILSTSQNDTLNLDGGQISAKNINFDDKLANINIDQANLTGMVNITATSLHDVSDSKTLELGNIDVSGDPTFFNNGNYLITGNITANANIAIIASGDILASPQATINIAAQSDNNGYPYNIEMIAGANITSTSTSVTINGGSSGGGSINLSNASSVNLVTTSNGALGNYLLGGNITLAAYAGSNAGSGLVVLPNNSTLNSSAYNYLVDNFTASSGSITIIAGAQNGTNIIGNIVDNGFASQNGSVNIYSAQPISSNGLPIVFDMNGNILSSNNVTYSSNTTNSNFIIGNINTAGGGSINQNTNEPATVYNGGAGGNVTINCGGNLTINSIATFGGGGGGGMNAVAYGNPNGSNGGNGGNISLFANGNVTINQSVNTSGGGGGGGGGGGIFTTGSPIGQGGAGGNAGSIFIESNNGNVSIIGPVLAAGGGGGSAGNYNYGGGGGGSFGGGGGGGAGASIVNPDLGGGGGGGGIYGGGGSDNNSAPGAGGGGYGGGSGYNYGGIGYGGNGQGPNSNGGTFGQGGQSDFGVSGGAVGQAGQNSSFDGTAGGQAGLGGVVVIKGLDVTVSNSINSFYNNTNFSGNYYSNDAISTIGNSGQIYINTVQSSITQSNFGGYLDTQSLALYSTFGNIGSSAISPFVITVPTLFQVISNDTTYLTLEAPSGSVFAKDTSLDKVILNSQTFNDNGQQFSATNDAQNFNFATTSAPTLNVEGPIYGSTISLVATNASNNAQINFNPTGPLFTTIGATTLNLISDASITSVAGVSAQSLNLYSLYGSIGSSISSPLIINANNMALSAPNGGVYVENNATSNVTIDSTSLVSSNGNSYNINNSATTGYNVATTTAPSLTNNATITAATVELAATNSANNATVNLRATVTGTTSVGIVSSGSITTNTLFLELNTTTLALDSINGSIGAIGAPIATSATSLATQASNGGVYIVDTASSTVTLNSQTINSSNGNSYTVNNSATTDFNLATLVAPTLNVIGPIYGNTISLVATNASNNAQINFNPTGPLSTSINATTLNLISDASITSVAGVSAQSLNLYSLYGSIGSSISSPLIINANNMALSAPNGGVYVENNATGNVTIDSTSLVSSNGNSYNINNSAKTDYDITSQAYIINLDGIPSLMANRIILDLTGPQSTLNIGTSLIGPNLVYLSASDNINFNLPSELIQTNNFVATSTNGSIGSLSNPLLISSPQVSAQANNGSVFILDTTSQNISLTTQQLQIPFVGNTTISNNAAQEFNFASNNSNLLDLQSSTALNANTTILVATNNTQNATIELNQQINSSTVALIQDGSITNTTLNNNINQTTVNTLGLDSLNGQVGANPTLSPSNKTILTSFVSSLAVQSRDGNYITDTNLANQNLNSQTYTSSNGTTYIIQNNLTNPNNSIQTNPNINSSLALNSNNTNSNINNFTNSSFSSSQTTSTILDTDTTKPVFSPNKLMMDSFFGSKQDLGSKLNSAYNNNSKISFNTTGLIFTQYSKIFNLKNSEYYDKYDNASFTSNCNTNRNDIHNIKINMGTLVYDYSTKLAIDSNSDKIILLSGELLVKTSKDTNIQAGKYNLNIKKKTIALIYLTNNSIFIKNLGDEYQNSITVKCNNISQNINCGKELIITNNDNDINTTMQLCNVSRRNITINFTDNNLVMAKSEFSIVNLFAHSNILKLIYKDSNFQSVKLCNQIIKMAACIQQVTSSHGNYSGL